MQSRCSGAGFRRRDGHTRWTNAAEALGWPSAARLATVCWTPISTCRLRRRCADLARLGPRPLLSFPTARAQCSSLWPPPPGRRHLDVILSVDARWNLQTQPSGLSAGARSLEIPADPDRLRVGERVGRHRRQGIRLHFFLDQSQSGSARSARAQTRCGAQLAVRAAAPGRQRLIDSAHLRYGMYWPPLTSMICPVT